MFDIQLSNVKMIPMLNVKLFDVRHSNGECQNDLKSNSLMFNKAKSKDKFSASQNYSSRSMS